MAEPGYEPPLSPRRPGHNYPLHLGLFLATCVTTTFVGLLYVGPPAPDFLMGAQGLARGGMDLENWWRGFLFSGTLLFILGTHEMGHFIAARRHGVDVSLPYFIPVPFGLGTFGAVIAMREKIRSRDALLDVGAAGPLAGLVAALPLLVVGLAHSPVGRLPTDVVAMTEGNSLLYFAIKFLVHGEALPSGGRDVFLNPVAWAAWVGLLVTMLNLIPIGQFDGGHVFFAYFGERYRRVSRWVHRGLLGIGACVLAYVFWSAYRTPAPLPPPTERAAIVIGEPGSFPAFATLDLRWMYSWQEALTVAALAAMPWFLWAVLAHFIGASRHPAVSPTPLSPRRRLLGILVMVVFLLIFMPIPLRQG